jgi:CCR4-NOT transcription complex subunit 2
MGAPPSALSKMPKFSDETLFYIFYAMPQDLLQDAAAYELYALPRENETHDRTRRNWRYHKGIQLWLTKPQEPAGVRANETFEQGEFIFWDVNMWQKTKLKFFLSYDMLEHRETSLSYEEANPEAAKLERQGSVESRKVSGKQIGGAAGAES